MKVKSNLELCCVANCYSTQHSSTLFRFPKSEPQAVSWAEACNRHDFKELLDIYGYIPASKICSHHFTLDQFVNPNSKKKKLKSGAQPTLFSFNSCKIKTEPEESSDTIISIGGTGAVELIETERKDDFTQVIKVQPEDEGYNMLATVENVDLSNQDLKKSFKEIEDPTHEDESIYLSDFQAQPSITSDICDHVENSPEVSDRWKRRNEESNVNTNARKKFKGNSEITKISTKISKSGNSSKRLKKKSLKRGRGRPRKHISDSEETSPPCNHPPCEMIPHRENTTNRHESDDSFQSCDDLDDLVFTHNPIAVNNHRRMIKKKKKLYSCAYTKCENSTNSYVNQNLLFPFPKQPDRCFAWVKNTGEKCLLAKVTKLGAPYMNCCFRLCYLHFEKEAFLSAPSSLVWNAVPTNFPNLQTNLQYPSHIFVSSNPVSFCADSRCPNSFISNGSNAICFSFPSSYVKCALWVTNCGDPILSDHFKKFGSKYMSETMFLCSKHFKNSCIIKSPISLVENAVPTVFHYGRHAYCADLHNQSSSNDSIEEDLSIEYRKSTDETVAVGNEILSLKEELAHLRNDRNRQRGKHRYVLNQLAQINVRTTDFTLDNAIQYLKANLSPTAFCFFKVQIFSAKKPRWNEDSMDFALHANNCGKNVYSTLSSMFRLPCAATIRRFEALSPKANRMLPSQVTSYVSKNNKVFHKNVFKKSPAKRPIKLPKLDCKRNRTVAQILIDFLGKQSKEETSSSDQKSSDECSNVENFPNAYVMEHTERNEFSGQNELVITGDIITTSDIGAANALVAHNAIVTTNNLEIMDDAKTMSANLANQGNYIKTIEMNDGTIEYITYDNDEIGL